MPSSKKILIAPVNRAVALVFLHKGQYLARAVDFAFDKKEIYIVWLPAEHVRLHHPDSKANKGETCRRS
jgi:hypothetical protein